MQYIRFKRAAEPKWYTAWGAAQDAGLCWSPVFLLPHPLGASGCSRALPRASPPERGEESWPEAPLSPAVPLQLEVARQGGCNLPFTLMLEINSCISETRVCSERCCAHSASFSGGQKEGGFLHERVFPSNPCLPLRWQGLPSHLYRNCPFLRSLFSCMPLSAGNVLCQEQRLTSPSTQEASR